MEGQFDAKNRRLGATAHYLKGKMSISQGSPVAHRLGRRYKLTAINRQLEHYYE
ncbi:hypothetical protein JV46_10730 [Solemya velum gill symbiont]|uniref:Uncharacterized protein n=1 Tax=Solemya velum gill symbiont TaxID=2340 RepID=A0A0B0H542_SOVGS|nr:hypothetical protein JV46_10730 [Solemya velum gill symbiont]